MGLTQTPTRFQKHAPWPDLLTGALFRATRDRQTWVWSRPGLPNPPPSRLTATQYAMLHQVKFTGRKLA